MSEPVSNADVEDVLASIRRLVSEHKRPVNPDGGETRAETVEEAHVEAIEEQPCSIGPDHDAGRLVLTPSLRVAEVDDDDVDERFEDTPDNMQDNATSKAYPVPSKKPFVLVGGELPDTPESQALEAEANLDAQLEEQADHRDAYQFAEAPFDFVTNQPDVPNPQEAEEAAKAVEAEVATESAEPVGLEDAAEDVATDETPDPVTLEVSDTEAQDKPGETSGPDEEFAPAMELEVNEAVESQDLAAGDDIDPADSAVETDTTKATPESEAAPFRMASSLGAKIAALESMVGRREDAWDPDGTVEDANSGTDTPSFEWRRAAALPDVESSEVQPEALDAENAHLDEALLDEDALRDMVAEIVRQELQGALGERITRNVRKLVRREIHRALATRELD